MLECFFHPADWAYLYSRVFQRQLTPKQFTREQWRYHYFLRCIEPSYTRKILMAGRKIAVRVLIVGRKVIVNSDNHWKCCWTILEFLDVWQLQEPNQTETIFFAETPPPPRLGSLIPCEKMGGKNLNVLEFVFFPAEWTYLCSRVLQR